MFLDNKYTKWYMAIIYRAQTAGRTRKEGYFERHHIIPRSLGGSDEKHNLVLLTAREHYIVHLMLCRMLEGEQRSKMIFACTKLAGGTWYLPQGNFRSRTFERLRQQAAIESSKLLKGVPKTDEHKTNLRRSFAVSQSHKNAWQLNIKKAQEANLGCSRPDHSEFMRGLNADKHDTQHQWFNKKSNESFTGSRIQLQRAHPELRLDELWKVTNGKARSHKGWTTCSTHS